MSMSAKPNFSGRPLSKPPPLTLLVAKHLQSWIVCGVLKPGERLPTRKVLCKALDVSELTLRRAISRIAEGDLIEKRHGSVAYFVKQQTSAESLNCRRHTSPASLKS
jgi:GntR family transcriptional repressor for pyruvate dehydrogenase complex